MQTYGPAHGKCPLAPALTIATLALSRFAIFAAALTRFLVSSNRQVVRKGIKASEVFRSRRYNLHGRLQRTPGQVRIHFGLSE